MGKTLEALNRVEEAVDAYSYVLGNFSSDTASGVSECRQALVVLLQRMAVSEFNTAKFE